MNVKRYIADDVSQAMEKIRNELGRDAFILNTRKIRRKGFWGLFRKPLVEVVAAYENAPPEPARAAVPARAAAPPGMWAPPPTPEQDVMRFRDASPPPPAPPPGALGAYAVKGVGGISVPVAPPAAAVPPYIPGPAPGAETFSPLIPVLNTGRAPRKEDEEKIESLENKLDSLSTTLGNLVSKMQIKGDYRTSYNPEIEALTLSMIENEVHEEFAHRVAREVSEIVEKQKEDPGEVMEQIVKQYLGEAAPIKLKRFKRQVVLFAGPTGVGKTTSLAKLAAIYSINHHAKVGIVTTDTYRIAAVEQLKTYAEILELPISVAYTPEEVTECLREHEDKDVVFIDTAGKSPNDRSLEAEITQLIKHSQADEVHLVLSATTSFAGCLNILNTYSFLRDFKLLFTKMDETDTWGTVLNLKFLSDKPLSYMAAGQNVPDDIEIADIRKIIKRLTGREGAL
ncbi:MAG: flagellar biosynthesis protein FlhF [Oscillospiraceae bacterium]|nr:flagellar biosynthesis protein FlhF [Oscillospiraceae bacterium]